MEIYKFYSRSRIFSSFYIGCIPTPRAIQIHVDKNNIYPSAPPMFGWFSLCERLSLSLCLCMRVNIYIYISRKPNRINNGNVYKRNKEKRFSRSWSLINHMRWRHGFAWCLCILCASLRLLSRQAIHMKNREIHTHENAGAPEWTNAQTKWIRTQPHTVTLAPNENERK